MNNVNIISGNSPNTFIVTGQNGIRVIINQFGKVITIY